MKLIKLFEYYEHILLEGKYDSMFHKDYEKLREIFIFKGRKQRIEHVWKNNIKWAKQKLEKQDRIVWFLRWAKAHHLAKLSIAIEHAGMLAEWKTYADEFKVEYSQEKLKVEQHKLQQRINKDLKKIKSTKSLDVKTVGRFILELPIIMEDLEHFLSLDIHKIDNHTFTNETPNEIRDLFLGYEEEWKEKRKRTIQHDDSMTPMIQVSPNLAWFNLESPSCSIEGQAMGHCGNSPSGRDTNQTIFSLREHMGEGWWKPHATFIYFKREKSLGEMKGVYNKKPKKETYPAIIKLLMDKRIHAIHGGGYLPEANFSINDLPDADANKIIKKKPSLLTPEDYMNRFGVDKYLAEFGWDHMEKHVGITEYIIKYKLDGEVIKRLKKEGVEFIGGNNDIVITTLKDINEFMEDYGDSTATWVAKVLSGEDFLDLDYITVNKDDLEHQLDTNQTKQIEKYTSEKYPEDYDDDWYYTLNNNDDKLLKDEGLEEIFFNATRSVVEKEMGEALNNAYTKDNLKNRNDVSVFVYPNELKWDSKIKLMVEHHEFLTELDMWMSDGSELQRVSDIKDLISDLDDGIEFKVDQPHYGFDGFDDKHFKEEVDALLKDIK